MKTVILFTASIFASQMCLAQTPETSDGLDSPSEIITCLGGTEMNALFQSGEASILPRYAENVGARVQRQHPNTKLSGQAKHILQADGNTLGICEYSSHIGIVAVFLLGGAQADAYDETCDNGTCKNGDYWRDDWRASDEAEDQPGQETIKACYRDVDGIAFPSAQCGFLPPAE